MEHGISLRDIEIETTRCRDLDISSRDEQPSETMAPRMVDDIIVDCWKLEMLLGQLWTLRRLCHCGRFQAPSTRASLGGVKHSE